MSISKTIAKNTAFLYIRMLLIMVVSFYSSRIVIKQLGVSDYGVYSLVGGIVAMLGFFNSAMAAATQRYLTFDIGEGNLVRLQKTFSTTLTIHFGIAVFLLAIAETIGLWYVNNIMVFPHERIFAVNVVYQFSIATALLGIIQVPYNALIIARERMKIYAYVSILEAILKLGVVFLLLFLGYDKLITYAILIFMVANVNRIIEQIYCRKNFKESIYKFEYDKNAYKELMSYTGWNSLGSIALLVCSQGNNLILNLFFGTVVNAAFGITMLVQGVILSFAHNFQTAVNPQIVKLYAQGNHIQMQNLIFKTAKFSFYLLFILTTPIFLNTDYILKLWLKTVPEYTPLFVNLSLINILIEILGFSLIVGIQAKGKIKQFQIVLGTLVFLNLPISYLILKMGGQPYSVFLVLIIISVFALICRLFFVKKLLGFATLNFVKSVLVPVGLVVVFTLIGHLTLSKFFNFETNADNIHELFLITIFDFLLIVFLVFLLGVNREEKKILYGFLKK
jgi:O-antigen/teichoic acid export membrane protein